MHLSRYSTKYTANLKKWSMAIMLIGSSNTGDDDAVLLIVYDEGLGDIQTYLLYLENFKNLYELL